MNILNQYQIKSIVKIALEAGKIAMKYFRSNNLNLRNKPDNTPLTIADSLISELIFKGLSIITPDIPIICEEGKNRDFGKNSNDRTFWLIDPIDGTSSFSIGDPEFTINIGLIKNKKPIFGVIFAPAIANSPFYYIDENGKLIKYCVHNHTNREFFATKRNENNNVIIASKRSADSDILKHFPSNTKIKHPITLYKVSSSLKFLYLIEGKADLYLHLRKSMEWDIAAGQALLEAAGGEIINLDGSEFLYEKADLVNQPFLARLLFI
jgi:3'(2'), 5'-bisphosphate nucleotidase